MCWSFKRPCVSNHFSLAESNPAAFSPGCYMCTFWVLVLLAANPSLVFRPQSSLVDPAGCLIIPLAPPPMGTQPSLSSLYHTPYQTSCAEAGSVCLKLYASLWLLLSCLFRVVSPQLSCNSRLVPGGGQSDFNSLLCHLPPLV